MVSNIRLFFFWTFPRTFQFGQTKHATQPIAGENNFLLHIGIQAPSVLSGDSALVCDWQLGLVSFPSVEVMFVPSIGSILKADPTEMLSRLRHIINTPIASPHMDIFDAQY